MKKKLVIATGAACIIGLACWLLCAPPSRVTRENFLRLRKGMTEAELEEIFGERSQDWEAPRKSTFGLTWRLWSGTGTAYVTFDGRRGGLVGKSWIEDGYSSTTKENLERVRVGMTLAQVEAVFGRPPDAFLITAPSPWQKSDGGDVALASWRDIDGLAYVTFADNDPTVSLVNDDRKALKKWWIPGGGGTGRRRPGNLEERILRFLRPEK
jgi:hypothetical protein